MAERKFLYPHPDGLNFESFKYLPIGLITAVIVDLTLSQHQGIIMTGWMNREAYEQTTATGKVYFYTRKGEMLWPKGKTSGNIFTVIGDIETDCDADTIIVPVRIEGAGVGCHLGTKSCFDQKKG